MHSKTKRQKAEDKVQFAGKSHEFRLAMSQGQNMSSDESPLLATLNTLDLRELSILKAIASLAASPPEYQCLDAPGQLALTIARFYKAMKDAPEGATSKLPDTFSISKQYSLMKKRAASARFDNKSRLPPKNASAGCAAALLSEYQGLLLDCIRGLENRWDWATLRDTRASFWVRSDSKLRKISEEIGQNMYRKTRDILKSAIFFIIAGKKRTLINLSAADRTESGQKFFKFMTNSPNGLFIEYCKKGE